MTIVAQPFKTHNLPNFGLGLNTMLSPDELDDRELADCENIEIDSVSIKSAAGYAWWDNTPSEGPYYGIYFFKKSDGTQQLIRQRQGVLEYDSAGSGDWLPCTLPTTGSPATEITLTATTPSFATLNDICIFSNGTDDVMSSADGITWTSRATLPKGLVMNNGRNRLLYLMIGSSLIWWSDINDPLTVNANSWQYVEPNDGQRIVGGRLTTTGSMLLFKNTSVYEIDDITLGMIAVDKVGDATCASHFAIATTEDSVMWMGYDYMYEFIGGVIRNISGRINPTGRQYITRGDLVRAIYSNGYFRVSMPDKVYDSAQTYNCQEYIVYKKLFRNDALQPYAITRNRRFIGCYGEEDWDYEDGGRDITIYIGDSTTATAGSPASTTSFFGWINEYRDQEYDQGLAGSAQTCWFMTKYFTENIPYYVKKYKKLFYELNISQDVVVKCSYRFSPYDQWTQLSNSISALDIDIEYDDGDSGDFSEGYSFAGAGINRAFVAIENAEKPRGIQFKIEFISTNDVTEFSLAYQFMAKPKFR